MQFWEMAFYSDVQRNIRPVYLSNEEFAAEQEKKIILRLQVIVARKVAKHSDCNTDQSFS